MPLKTPERVISTAPKCDRPVPGNGLMSYHCSLPQGHEEQTLDTEDPQPCYAIESDRSGRAWDAWRRREDEREASKGAAAIGDETDVQWLTCPVCSEPALRVVPGHAVCQNCGAAPEVQSDVAMTQVGPSEPDPSIEEVEGDVPEGFVSTASTPDPEIMAAAQQAATHPDWTRLDEDVSSHVLGPFFDHGDRYCGYHNRLGKWVFGAHEALACLRVHEIGKEVNQAKSDRVEHEVGRLLDEGGLMSQVISEARETERPWLVVAEGSAPPTEEQLPALDQTYSRLVHSLDTIDLVVIWDNGVVTARYRGDVEPKHITVSVNPTLTEEADEPDHTLADFHCQMRPADQHMAGHEDQRCLVCRPLTEAEQRQEERWQMNRGTTLGDAIRGYHATLDEKAAQAEPTKQRDGDQRLPAGGDKVVQDWVMHQGARAYERGEIDIEQVEQINAIMQESKRVGTERYGQPLKTFDGRLNIKDLAEELRDALVYVSKMQMVAEADKATLVRMVAQAFNNNLSAHAVPEEFEQAVAEVAVDTILDWVLVQRIGPDQVRPTVEVSG